MRREEDLLLLNGRCSVPCKAKGHSSRTIGGLFGAKEVMEREKLVCRGPTGQKWWSKGVLRQRSGNSVL